MEKIALITDTTSDLSDAIIKQYDIKELAFRIIYKDREYRDKFEITSKEVYENLSKEMPTSSMPAIDDMEVLFDDLEKQGYTHVIAVVLSSGLSGIYNGLKIVSENHPNLITHICDSTSISMGEGIIVEECGKLIKQGKKFQEIVESIPSIKDRIHQFFVIGTLECLKKGGRIGKVAGTIGELLNIKPIIAVDRKDGKFFTYDKVRGRKQSLNKLMDLIKSYLEMGKGRLYVLHGNAEEEAKKVFEKIKDHPKVTNAFLGGCISPVSGVHSGPGLVGIACFMEE